MNEQLLGLVFLNDKKLTDKSPDYRGAVMVGGKIYNVSMWARVGKQSGKTFFSLAFKEKDEKKEQPKIDEMYTNRPYPGDNVEQVAQAVGGKTEILDEKPLGEEEVPF